MMSLYILSPLTLISLITTITAQDTFVPDCNRAGMQPVGVCLKLVHQDTAFDNTNFSYKLACDGGENYTMNMYQDLNCTGIANSNLSFPCNGDCYCGFDTPCPYAKYSAFEPDKTNQTNQTNETRCGRAQNIPLNICGKISTNGSVKSEKLICDSKTRIFTQIVYDDVECEGSIINETVYNCTDPDTCICSDIPCDYVFWTEYSGNKSNTTGNETCYGDVAVNWAFVLNVCGAFQDVENVKMICSNNTVDIVNCVDNSTLVNDAFKPPLACDVQCFDVNNTLPNKTNDTNDTCSGIENAVVINQCIVMAGKMRKATCTDETNGILSFRTCDDEASGADHLVCELECFGNNVTMPGKQDDNKAGIIIGAVIGAFFAVMICFGVIWAIMDNWKKKNLQKGYGTVGVGDTDTEDVEIQENR